MDNQLFKGSKCRLCDSFTVLSVVYCGVPEKIENGYIVNTTGADYRANATYECNGGFTHSGHTAMCSETGEWINLPICSCMYSKWTFLTILNFPQLHL